MTTTWNVSTEKAANQLRGPKQQRIKGMNKTKDLLIGVIIIAAFALAGCSARGRAMEMNKTPVGGANATPTPLLVDTLEIKLDPTAAERMIPAVVSNETTALLLSQREGTLVRLNVEEGARVGNGE